MKLSHCVILTSTRLHAAPGDEHPPITQSAVRAGGEERGWWPRLHLRPQKHTGRAMESAVSEDRACQSAGESHKRAQTSLVTAGTVIIIMATIKPTVVTLVVMMVMMLG